VHRFNKSVILFFSVLVVKSVIYSDLKNMSENKLKKFQTEREHLNEIVMKYAGLNIKRFYHLDSRAYQDGKLPKKTKEMLGLVASLVLRCDDCITYHLIQCHQAGLADGELEEVLTIGLIVGGSITIPHLRRALQTWEELTQASS